MILHLQYGQALYNAAVNQKTEEKVLENLGDVAHLFEDKSFATMMTDVCFLPLESGRKVLASTFEGQVEPLVFHLLVLLSQERALNLVPKINRVYRELFYKAKGIAEITVVTARTMNDNEQKSIQKTLEKQLQKPAVIEFKTDASLIAGIQVFERGYLTDYSVKNYLEHLEKTLNQQELKITN